MVVQVDGRSLAGDYSQAIGGIFNIAQDYKKNKLNKEVLGLADEVMSDGVLDAKELITLSQKDPNAAQALFKLDQQKKTEQLAQAQQKNADNFNEASSLLSMSYDERRNAIIDMATQKQEQGEDIGRYIELANMPEDQQSARLKNILIKSGDYDKLYKSGLIGQPKDERTSKQKEFEFARQQGFQGTFLDYQKELKKSGATKIENNVNANSDLTRSQKTAQQKKVLSAKRDLVSLRKIKSRITPDLFNTWNRTKNSISNQAEKLGFERSPESREFNKRLESVITPVKQYFNRYRKEITGAAAAIQELEQLKQSTINGDLSYTEFVHRLDQIMEIAESDASSAKEALRDGVDLSDQSASSNDPLGIL